MKFKEGNEQHWITCPESHKPHIGIPSDIEYAVTKHRGRFLLQPKKLSDVVASVIPIYPIGCSTELVHAMEMECANRHNEKLHGIKSFLPLFSQRRISFP